MTKVQFLAGAGKRGFVTAPRPAHFCPVLRLRVHRPLYPLPKYIFMAWYIIKQWIWLYGMVLS